MEENKEPRLFTGDVMKRFILGKDWDKFLEDYKNNRRHEWRSARKVNDKDLEILADYKAGMTKIRDLANKYDMTSSAILTALRIAALSKV